jgi:hypothetical protein
MTAFLIALLGALFIGGLFWHLTGLLARAVDRIHYLEALLRERDVYYVIAGRCAWVREDALDVPVRTLAEHYKHGRNPRDERAN